MSKKGFMGKASRLADSLMEFLDFRYRRLAVLPQKPRAQFLIERLVDHRELLKIPPVSIKFVFPEFCGDGFKIVCVGVGNGILAGILNQHSTSHLWETKGNLLLDIFSVGTTNSPLIGQGIEDFPPGNDHLSSVHSSKECNNARFMNLP